MMQDSVDRIDQMTAQNPDAVDLARLLSFAVLIEPALLRATRLELLPRVDAGAEADLWFGPLVQTRSRDGIVLYPEVAELLRSSLQDKQANQSWRITESLHEYLSPAVKLEERLNWLSTKAEANAQKIGLLLQSALSALLVEKRSGVANWASRALPRLPPVVRGSEEAAMLAAASDLRMGRTWTLSEHLPGVRIPPWFSEILPDNFPDAELGISLTVLGITFDPTPAAGAERIRVPATDPRVVQLLAGGESRVIFVDAKTPRSVPLSLDGGPIELTTIAGYGFTIERDPTLPDMASASLLACTAYANCNQALIVWQVARPIESCLGFAIERTDSNGKTEFLKSLVGFSPPRDPAVQPTTVWPIQRFQWWDRSAERGGRFTYTVIPVIGSPNQFEAKRELAVQTRSVAIAADERSPVSAYFNREPGANQQNAAITISAARRPGGEIRKRLLELLTNARINHQEIYAALWILDDPELFDAFAALGKRAHILLSRGAVPIDSNVKARQALSTAVDLRSRNVSWQAHNSFMVVCDHSGRPQTVWTGSFVWSSGGLNAQDSDALLIQDQGVASHYLDRWNQLRATPSLAMMRQINAKPATFDLADGSRARLWSAPVENGADLADIGACLSRSRSAILFAVGPRSRQSMVNAILSLAQQRYVIGVARAVESANNVTVHRNGSETEVAADRGARKSSTLAQPPIGSRLIVIDPFDANPVVIGGSHFLSRKASGSNEEDLVIIEGNAELAAQCAVHIKGLVDHYAFRAYASTAKDSSWLRSDDQWQQPFMTGERAREIQFWMGSRLYAPSQTVAPQDQPEGASAKRSVKKPASKPNSAAPAKKAKSRKPERQKPPPVKKTSAKRSSKRAPAKKPKRRILKMK